MRRAEAYSQWGSLFGAAGNIFGPDPRNFPGALLAPLCAKGKLLNRVHPSPGVVGETVRLEELAGEREDVRLGAAARGRLSGELHARLEVGQKTLAGGGSLCYGGAKKAVQLLPSPRLPLLMLGLKGFILSSRKQFHPAP